MYLLFIGRVLQNVFRSVHGNKNKPVLFKTTGIEYYQWSKLNAAEEGSLLELLVKTSAGVGKFG